VRTLENMQDMIESHSDAYSETLKKYLVDRLDYMTKELIELTKEIEKWRR